MKTQQDTTVRLVALENLKAMCEHVSGTCHRYWVERVTRSRVWVGYSNPNEYGSERPMFAVLPCFPSDFADDAENPRVLLDPLRIVHDDADGEGWQSFGMLWECPTLWRSPTPESKRWAEYPLATALTEARAHVARARNALAGMLRAPEGTDRVKRTTERGCIDAHLEHANAALNLAGETLADDLRQERERERA